MNATVNTPAAVVQVPALDHDAMMLKRFGTKMSPNGRLERRIVANLIAHLAANGFELRGVWDGEEHTKVSDMKAAMELIFNLDQAHLYVCKPGFVKHWIFLVLGNGIDIVSDYSYTEGNADNFRAVMDKFDTEVLA